MTLRRAGRLLSELEEAARMRPAAERVRELLQGVARERFDDAETLLRLHETLLFLRAYPHSHEVLDEAGRQLLSFAERIEALRAAGADLSPLDEPDVSGLASSSASMPFSFEMTRALASRHAAELSIDWDGYTEGDRLGATLPRFLPLLREEALADANVPYVEWLRAAAGDEPLLRFLLRSFEKLDVPARRRAELFESLALPILWTVADSGATRTRMWRSVPEPFVQDEPLLSRRDVSLPAELARPPLPFRRAARAEGRELLAWAQDAMALRFRELYGFTNADPGSLVVASPGRGVELAVYGLPRGRRVPLRAGYALFILRNGVPIGYGDAFALFERLEVSFNVFYTFRAGESAWIFAQALRLYRSLLGSASFSVDPYQIGLGNEEAIDSGAFWFYRKLGFRFPDARLESLARREESRLARHPEHRSSPRLLQKLATGNLLLDAGPGRDWDRFHVRNLGLAASRRLVGERARRSALSRVDRLLSLGSARWSEERRAEAAPLMLVLALIDRLASWSAGELAGAARAVRAKSGARESSYIRTLRDVPRLREALIALGSGPASS